MRTVRRRSAYMRSPVTRDWPRRGQPCVMSGDLMCAYLWDFSPTYRPGQQSRPDFWQGKQKPLPGAIGRGSWLNSWHRVSHQRNEINMHKTSGKNKALAKIFLVTSDHINSFPLEDPDHPYAGWQFLTDCEKLGYPSIKVGANWYVFASEVGR